MRNHQRETTATRPRLRAFRKLAAAAVAVSLAIVPVIGTATAAEAATKHNGFQGGTGAGSGWLGDIEVANGVYGFCIDPAGLFPSGDTGGSDLITKFNGTTPTANPNHNDTRDVEGSNIRRLNAALWEYGDTGSSDRDAAAMGAYVYSITSAMHSGSDVDFYIDKRVTSSADRAAVKTRFDNIRDWVADNYNDSGKLSAKLTVLITDDTTLDGYVDVKLSSNTQSAQLTLAGATLRGSSSRTVAVENGDRVRITASRGSDAKYAVTAGVKAIGPWVYDTNVRIYKTGTSSQQMQRVIRHGDRERQTITARAFVTDPLPGEFEPVVTTTVEDPEMVIGQDFVDVVRADEADPAFPWQRSGSGAYVPIRATGTVYGPFADQPVQSDGVPEGAPIAGTIDTTFTGPGSYRVEVPNSGGKSGYYTWVWEIREEDQTVSTRDLLPDGYIFASPFGEAAETAVVAADVRVESVVSDPETGLFQVTSDTLTVTHNEETTGLWPNAADGTAAPINFEGTAYFVPGDRAPDRQADPTSDAVELGTVTFTANAVGDYAAAGEIKSPGVTNGYIVWRWIVPASQYVQRFEEDFAVPSQITRVLAPTIETEADPSVALGDTMGDTLIVSGPDMGEDTFATFRAFLRTGNDPVCDPASRVINTFTDPVTVTASGRYPSPRFETGTLQGLPVGTYDWKAALRTADGDLIAEGECGDLNEVTVVDTFALTTAAVATVDAGDTMYDVATITGRVPAGATLEFAAYTQTTETFVCDASTLYFTSAPVAAVVGDTKSATADAVAGARYAWVATVYDRTGAVMQQGTCGDPAEITLVRVPPVVPPVVPPGTPDVPGIPGIPSLPHTGLEIGIPINLMLTALFLGGVTLFISIKRRRGAFAAG